MKKIVINTCYGGFELSQKAREWIVANSNGRFAEEQTNYVEYDLERDDPILVECVETLREEANTWVSKLKVVEIPEDVEWEIDSYDGWEEVEEKHRKWG